MLLIILIFIQLLKTVYSGATDDNKCVSLLQSNVCSAFSQFYIGLPGLSNEYPFLINITTIEDFDNRLLEYVNSTSNYLFPLGCLSSNYNPIIPYARYSLTHLCAKLIQNPTYSLPCNFNYGLNPPPLCQQTCYDWVDSVAKITSSPLVCSNSIQRNETLASYTDHCNTWEGFNGTITQNCISGIANEPYSCGFGNDTSAACKYCETNHEDKCCQTIYYCHPSLSAGAIVGIVIGCTVAIALIVITFIWYCYRNKIHLHMKPFQFISPSSSTTASENNSSQPTPVHTVVQNKAVRQFDNYIGQFPYKHDIREIPNKPIITTTITNSPAVEKVPSITTLSSPLSEEFFGVIHPYSPQLPDELTLTVGDIICLALRFDDGWALGFNVTTGAKGAFPLVCISNVPEEDIDQLLTTEVQENNNLSLSTNTVIEKWRESLQPSLSLNSYYDGEDDTHHSNNAIPKRSASYRSYEYFEIESPSSPTLHTPFFNNNQHHPLQQHQQHQQ
ncbi:uncharacterized protein BX663DRAFT_507620 [Cokeromyces recurvatus]|uniref:uncharacterized protein n=1 Tax=Cokeromyces recurvatus TaxID=90255 RepID=UPI0022202F1D|nr:uncharacterized protein BX663DRAFT_507620 [Cokeromyces recurvatus]KAI7903147.1 hypothetical protein BX663DRAFT_507620 [Cokeromyces recurvatus]